MLFILLQGIKRNKINNVAQCMLYDVIYDKAYNIEKAFLNHHYNDAK